MRKEWNPAMNDLHCWRCHARLKDVPQPFGRRSECPACAAPLHVCRQCRHHDPGKANACRERAAEKVLDKTRANFCDWFQPVSPAPGAGATPGTPGNRQALDELFGGDGSPANPPTPQSLDDLFG